jgi:threonine dehydrogenase-like Zn-dependent dehydrogenase
MTTGTLRAPATTMMAATVVSPDKIQLTEAPIPSPGSDQVRVKIEGCGVCASNIPPFEGRPWFTYPLSPGQLGHEAWGTIDAVGDKLTEFHVGQRVAMLSNNAYAEYDVGGQNAVVALPPELYGQPFPAEPLGCAMNIFKRSGIKAGDTVAIVGIGFLGALLTRLAKNADARVIAVSRRPFSLQFARSMGADEAIEMDDHWKILEKVKQLTNGTFCDVVVEAVGKQWPLDLAAEMTKERGRLIVAGYHQEGPRQINMQLWNWRGLDVINAHERDPMMYLRGMKAAVEAVSSGALDPSSLYTHRFPLERLDEALRMTRDRPDGFMKALIIM